jgi:hypothetical protein
MIRDYQMDPRCMLLALVSTRGYIPACIPCTMIPCRWVCPVVHKSCSEVLHYHSLRTSSYQGLAGMGRDVDRNGLIPAVVYVGTRSASW